MHIAVADDRREDRFDTLLIAAFYFGGVFQLRIVEIAARRVGTGQQATALIDHRHVARRQPGDAAGDHMHDGADLSFIQRASRLQQQRDGGGRGFLLANEQRWFRHRQMHARAFNRAERFDSSRQFAFQRALVVHLLAELADAELLFIQQFKPNRAAFRQTLLSETQAQFMHFLCGHHERAAVLLETVGDIHLSKLRHDRAAVLI